MRVASCQMPCVVLVSPCVISSAPKEASKPFSAVHPTVLPRLCPWRETFSEKSDRSGSTDQRFTARNTCVLESRIFTCRHLPLFRFFFFPLCSPSTGDPYHPKDSKWTKLFMLRLSSSLCQILFDFAVRMSHAASTFQLTRFSIYKFHGCLT